jgi:hypothetical protein
MKKRIAWGGMSLGLFAALALIVAGCGQSDNKGGQAKDSGKQVAHKDDHGKDGEKAHDHSGWWCDEHGVPEAECSMCSSKVAAQFKKKGDWCDKHDRAMSQCFICNPKQNEFYAAKYRAKYGKEPPPIEEEQEKKDGDKK